MEAASSKTDKQNATKQIGTTILPNWVNEPTDAIELEQSHPKGHVEQMLTVDDVAAYLRVSTKTVRRQIAAGHISAIRIGRLIRVSAEELMRLTGIKYNSVISNKEHYRE